MNPVLLVTYLSIISVECVKILGVFPAPGYSQFILAEALMKELANRGHEVAVISPYRPKNEPPNYRTIIADDFARIDGDNGLMELGSKTLLQCYMIIYNYGNTITEFLLKNKDVQQFLHSDEHFDLVIVEQFFNDALMAFATHFRAPLVLFSSMGATEWNKIHMGIPILPSINALSFSSHSNRMTIFQRFTNVAGVVIDYFCRHYIFYPLQKELLKKYFPGDINFDETINNASLMLLNSHVTTSENALLPYNVIEIGGFHVVTNPLSKDMQELLDGAKDGAVLFSLGTNLRSADLSQEKIDIFFKVFGNMKERVLWKFEKDLPNKPSNVFISKWLKQNDILAHPNIKLFITHGGLLSTTEAIYHGVPMVGMPFFGDQRMNLARSKNNGIAKEISYSELTEEKLSLAINETINNPKYKNNIKKMSALLKDRPLQPLGLAMYWIEYVIRHNGTHFERPSSHLYWFELYMLDILCFILFNIFVLFTLAKCTLKFFRKQKCKKGKQDKINVKANKRKQQ